MSQLVPTVRATGASSLAAEDTTGVDGRERNRRLAVVAPKSNAELLPAPLGAGSVGTPADGAAGDDLGLAIARMMIRAEHDDRARGDSERRTAEAAEDAATRREIDALREKASSVLLEGITSGACKILGGALTFGGATARLEADGVTNLVARTAHLDTANRATAAATALDGSGQFGARAFAARGVAEDTRAREAERDAALAGRAREDAKRVTDGAAHLIQVAVDFVRDYEAAVAAARHAATERL
jgi:hypothetical protein